MPRYIIERNMPGAGELSREQLVGASKKSCAVLDELGPQVQWIESFVTQDKLYCVYIAPNVEAIQEHGRRGEFPVSRVAQIKTIISPLTAQEPCAT